jgi:predicted TIM-barrel fold metal-dependent hydrolase
VIDVDSHVTEPPDTWTSRVASSWGSAVPHVERIDGMDRWIAGEHRLGAPGQTAMAGFDGVMPNAPATYADMHPGAWDASARLRHLDDQHIWAQVLYPNVGGFGASYWLQLSDRRLALECVRAYNDFLTDFCSVAPDRLLAVTSIPFWDVEASVAEIDRCLAKGHRGINFCNQPDVHGEPPLFAEHWDPLWSRAQEADVPVNFHIGGGDLGGLRNTRGMTFAANFARGSALLIMDNMRCIGDLIFGGVCHRFPDVRFVSVESGVGFVPSLLETFDWQWRNGGVKDEHPEYDLLPSEYFRRQIYACFWFEHDGALFALDAYPDNILYETDFPHPTCQHPGPRTPATQPRLYAQDLLGDLPEATLRKVLCDNAARVYSLDVPAMP